NRTPCTPGTSRTVSASTRDWISGLCTTSTARTATATRTAPTPGSGRRPSTSATPAEGRRRPRARTRTAAPSPGTCRCLPRREPRREPGSLAVLEALGVSPLDFFPRFSPDPAVRQVAVRVTARVIVVRRPAPSHLTPRSHVRQDLERALLGRVIGVGDF